MNNFYKKNKFLQWLIAIFMLGILMSLIFFGFQWTSEKTFWRVLSIPFWLPFGIFFTAPFLTLIGIIKYKSPMLCLLRDQRGILNIHSGTTFDYLMVMKNVKWGHPFQKKILEFHLEGLLRIIDEIEKGVISKKEIFQASSYFFNEKTANHLGFKKSKKDYLALFLFIADYFDLVILFSIKKRKLAFPKLKNVITIKTTGEELVKFKKAILEKYMILKNRNQKL